MKRVLILGMLLLLGLGFQAFLAGVPTADGPSGGTMAFLLGFLLLTAYVAGQAANGMGLPRITGYIILGVLVGPGVLGVLTEGNVSALEPVDDIAISLIALTAGAELRLKEIRERGRAMLTIMGTEMVTVFVLTSGCIVLFSGLLPFTEGLGQTAVLVVALIFGSIAIANSPAVAVALINETRSRGPVASTVLGVTVIKDVTVIVLFAVSLSLARAVLGGEGLQADFALTLVQEIGGSIVVGAFSGWVLARYFVRHGTHPVLIVLAAALLNAQIADAFHLEVLLLSLTAGFFLENASGARGEDLLEAVEANSLPFYALFFSLAGAKIDIAALPGTGLFVLLFVVVRGMAVYGGTWAGSRLVNAEPTVQRYAWTGFVSQAGVTIGMVVIAARAFPEWGPDLMTLFVAMVAVHELVGPVLFQWGLKSAGEVGKRDEPRGGREAPAERTEATA